MTWGCIETTCDRISWMRTSPRATPIDNPAAAFTNSCTPCCLCLNSRPRACWGKKYENSNKIKIRWWGMFLGIRGEFILCFPIFSTTPGEVSRALHNVTSLGLSPEMYWECSKIPSAKHGCGLRILSSHQTKHVAIIRGTCDTFVWFRCPTIKQHTGDHYLADLGH